MEGELRPCMTSAKCTLPYESIVEDVTRIDWSRKLRRYGSNEPMIGTLLLNEP